MAGRESITIRSARSDPLKSGISTSTDVSGRRRLISMTHAAKASAPPFGKIVTVHRSDHHVLEPHALDSLGEASGLERIESGGGPMGDSAIGAVSGAHVAQDHERGGLVLPTLPDVRTAGFLAHGVEAELPHHPLEVRVAWTARRLDLEPRGLPRLRDGTGCRRVAAGARRDGRVRVEVLPTRPPDADPLSGLSAGLYDRLRGLVSRPPMPSPPPPSAHVASSIRRRCG